MTPPSLYIHVPFCARKCHYCAFFSERPSDGQMDRYVGALVRELELIEWVKPPSTIFFGGGTPSLLSLAQWNKILQALAAKGLARPVEWTVECNPATVSADKAQLLRESGVNRISMGVQSLDELLLEKLGRVHSRQQVFHSFEILRAAGFDNVNLDLMFAIPGQSMETWDRTLEEILALGSEHLSCYEVIYEEDTPLFEQLRKGMVDLDEDLAAGMYDRLIDRAAAAGFHQYEIANFARHQSESGRVSRLGHELPRHACLHNVNYWRGGSFHGLGPGATGYWEGMRTRNWANTQLYCEQIEQGKRAIESSEKLNPLGRAGETAAFGLRMNVGWGFDEFRTRTGFDLRDEWEKEMNQLEQQENGERDELGFRLTRRGLRFADAAAEMFLRS